MGREIKFRAWDKKSKAMIMNPLSFPELYPLNELMQYTGLKDKNRKEIYESDNIQGNLFDDRLPIAGTVVYDAEHALYALQNEAGLTPLYKIDQKEVTGNVLETHVTR